MAAATAVRSHTNAQGNRRVHTASFTAPANGDTYDSGLTRIFNAQISYNSAAMVAADAIGITYATSGGVVTFNVVGTARDVDIQLTGV